MWVDVQKVESQDSVSRYELARLLNVVECKDCINPNQDMISKYVKEFWSSFVTGSDKNFSDITFLGGLYNESSYYYCVAYAADNTYMRWYPKATSTICGGQFCGEKATTTAEFVQVVINILAKYIYKDLQLNRKQVNTWLSKLKSDSYEAKNFGTVEREIITKNSISCENNCALQNPNEVNVYLKYCMFNLSECSMQEIGKIKKWFWPVAELNLLYNQSIIDIDQNQRKNTDKNIDGKTVLETLFKLNGKVRCDFNNDYDCDGKDNNEDSCPNRYNPNQRDIDNDGIWDVCDDDIDNDTIKNPIGIVDEEGKIDISKRTENVDNCLFVVNTDQQDNNQNSIGDACETIGNQLGIYISIDKLQWSAPLTATFSAITEWLNNEVQRDFGDGTQGQWASTIHTFVSPGMYNVQATARGNTSNATAQVIVIVWGQAGDDKALQARASSVGDKVSTESQLSTMLLGDFDEIQRTFPAENSSSKKLPNQSFKKIFSLAGQNPVIAKWYKNWALAGISYFTIGIGEGKWALLRSNVTNPEVLQKILFDTNTYNINQNDVVQVNRDFWDENKQNNTTLTMEYTYKTSGKKVITQIITLTDGTKLTNMITINIIDKSLLNSYALLMTPSKLIANVGEKITFSTYIMGTLLKTPLIQIAEFADGTTQKKAGTEKMPSIFTHSYQKNWSLTPQDSMYIDQCTYLKNQATIAIKGTETCLDAKIQWNLGAYKCDLDGDNIPDLCDSDIDNDGIPNLLGLINFENKDCSYMPEINLNQEILTKHYQSICSLDNAPFSNNPDQLDLNMDGIGDTQNNVSAPNNDWETLDSDGDGIVDTQDLCPTIQETWNGTNDEDGCPEVGQDFACNQWEISDILTIQATQCNQCPCQFWDFASDLTNNDQVRAVLRDKKKTIQYKFSLPWIVDF